jgi:autotransporter-associated beta strand protein
MHQRSAKSTAKRVNLAILTAVLGAAPASIAGTIWDGGGATSSITDPLNWDADTAPAFDGTAGVSFGSAGSIATIDSNVTFTGVTINRTATAGFTLAAGGGNLILNSTSTGATKNFTRSSVSGGSDLVSAPIQINTNAAGTAKLFNVVNNKAGGTSLRFTGAVGLAAGATTNYAIRYEGVAGTVTRFEGAISGANLLQPSSGAWAGELVIAGNQSLSAAAITMNNTTGFGTVTGKLTLGETAADAQSWGAITLNQNLNLSVGGTITATSLSGSATAAKVTGSAGGAGVLRLTSGTIGTGIALGGTGANENAFGLTKQGVGTLTISGDKTFTGPTTVTGGSLVINNAYASPATVTGGSLQLTGTSSAGVTVNAGGGLAGEGSTTSSLTFGSGSSSVTFDPATTAAFTAASVNVGGDVVFLPSSAVTVGTPYTVLKVTGGFGTTPLSAFVSGRGDTFSYASGNTELVLTPGIATPLALKWKGNAANPTNWDVAGTANWVNGAAPERFFSGDSVTFDDTASSFAVALQSAVMSPGSVTFNNAVNAYTLTGGGIGGAGTITKNGAAAVSIAGPLSNSGGLVVNAGTLTLGSAGTLTGGVVVNGGELSFATLAAINPASNSITLGGGKVTFTGATTITNDVQNVTISASGSTIGVDSPANITWRIGGKVTGSGDWTKSGPGVLSLGRSNNTNPNNDFTGKLTVTGGTLDIRWGDSLGATTQGTDVQNATLLIQNFGQTTGTTVTVAEPLSFSGASYLTSLCQELKIYTNQFTGPIAVSGTLGVSTATSPTQTPNTLELTGNTITTSAGSTLALGLLAPSYPTTIGVQPQTINVGSNIVGDGAVTVQGAAGSRFTLSGTNTYAGSTTVNSGTLVVGASGALPSGAGKGNLVINGGATAAGTVDLNGNDVTVNGLGGSAGTVAGRIVNDVAGAKTLSVGAANTTSSFAGVIADNSGTGGTVGLRKIGAGTLTLSGANTYSGGTTVDGGSLQLTLPAQGSVLNAARTTDIRSGKLQLDYTGGSSPAATVAAALATSFASGFTTGQFRSSTAAANRGIGWLDDAGTSTLTIAAALYGDANLDGTVNFDDLLKLAANYNTSGKNWAQGDSNYDGTVNFDDLLKLAANYNQTITGSFGGDWALAQAVPEPTVLTIVAAGTAVSLRRRRR